MIKGMLVLCLLVTTLLTLTQSAKRQLQTGVATSTVYWDCNAGFCHSGYVTDWFFFSRWFQWSLCYTKAPFKAPADNPYGADYYGTAAVSRNLGLQCEACYKITAASNQKGFTPGINTTLVVRSTNQCPPENEKCAAGLDHFDIAAPGFDSVQFSFGHICELTEAEELEGFLACGDGKNRNGDCNCGLFKNDVLREGCEIFRGLRWKNPEVWYEELESCPPELAAIPSFDWLQWLTHQPPKNCLARGEL